MDIWLKLLEDNCNARRVAYITATKEIFKQIPLTIIKSLTPKQKFQKLMTKLAVDGKWKKVLRD